MIMFKLIALYGKNMIMLISKCVETNAAGLTHYRSQSFYSMLVDSTLIKGMGRS